MCPWFTSCKSHAAFKKIHCFATNDHLLHRKDTGVDQFKQNVLSGDTVRFNRAAASVRERDRSEPIIPQKLGCVVPQFPSPPCNIAAKGSPPTPTALYCSDITHTHARWSNRKHARCVTSVPKILHTVENVLPAQKAHAHAPLCSRVMCAEEFLQTVAPRLASLSPPAPPRCSSSSSVPSPASHT